MPCAFQEPYQIDQCPVSSEDVNSCLDYGPHYLSSRKIYGRLPLVVFEMSFWMTLYWHPVTTHLRPCQSLHYSGAYLPKVSESQLSAPLPPCRRRLLYPGAYYPMASESQLHHPLLPCPHLQSQGAYPLACETPPYSLMVLRLS